MLKFDVPLLRTNDLTGLSDVDYSEYVSKLNDPDVVVLYGAENLTALLNKIGDIDTSVYPAIEEAKNNNTLTIRILGEFLYESNYASVDSYMDNLELGDSLEYLDTYLAGGSLDKIIKSTSGISLDSLSSFLTSTSLRKILSKASDLPSNASPIKSFVSVVNREIDGVFDEYKNKLSNIENKLQSFKDNSALQGNNNTALSKMMSKKVVNMKTLLQDSKKEELKEEVDKKASRSVGNLDEIKDNDVKYARGLVSSIPDGVKGFFSERWEDIKKTAEALEEARSDAETKSADVVKESVEAGRPAASPTDIKAKCASYGQSYNEEVDRRGSGRNFDKRRNFKIPTSHPDPSSWSNLSFVVGNVLKMETRGRKVTEWGYHTDIGYYGTDIEVLTMMNEVGKMLSKTITISSAYRPQEYNSLVGGAKGSQHLKGNALDCLMKGVNRNDFVSACKAVGFRGFGYYSTFIHADIGSARSWRG